jgi:hypothetical protein
LEGNLNFREMKNSEFQKLRTALVVIIGVSLFTFTGCEREDGELVPAKFPSVSEVFTDTFSGGLDYAAFGDSKLTAFDVDTEVAYLGTTSIRFAVPDAIDPEGAYAGGIIATSGGRLAAGDLIIAGGRDLSAFNTLSFWAKSSQPANIDQVGFGTDFDENKFTATITNVPVNSNWQKYYIPLPNPDVLTQEKGMFLLAEGPEGGRGYTLWIDEIRFEKLPALATRRAIFNGGDDDILVGFTGQSVNLSGLGVLFNLPNGQDVVVNASSNYFEFFSSNSAVAQINGTTATIGSAGSSTITAQLGDLETSGSLKIQSQGAFNAAPTPTRDPANVISLFSDTYTNEPVDFYNGYYAPFQTTTSADFVINGNNILNYQNFNFVGIEFNQNVPTIDGSDMTHLHVDIFIPGAIPGGVAFNFRLVDFGADDSFGGGDDTNVGLNLTAGTNPAIVSGQWISLDLNITGLTNRSNLGQILFTSDGGSAVSSFYADNLYFYDSTP